MNTTKKYSYGQRCQSASRLATITVGTIDFARPREGTTARLISSRNLIRGWHFVDGVNCRTVRMYASVRTFGFMARFSPGALLQDTLLAVLSAELSVAPVIS